MFNVVTILSLLLCVAVCGLLLESYRAGDAIELWSRRTTDQGTTAMNVGWLAVIRDGEFAVGRAARIGPASSFDPKPPKGGWSRGDHGGGPIRHPTTGATLGVFGVWRPIRTTRGVWYDDLIVGGSLWGLAAVLAVLPLVWTASWWRRFSQRRLRARDAQPCAQCGYDLRATPGRCPECGKVAAA